MTTEREHADAAAGDARPVIRRAHELVPDVAADPRRQDKVIAAIVRGYPRAILQDAVDVTENERQEFRARAVGSGPQGITDADYEKALSRTPTAIKDPADPEQLRRRFAPFQGDDPEAERRRHVLAFFATGSSMKTGDLDPQAMHGVVHGSHPSAVRFEAQIPQVLATVGDPEGYPTAIHEVGLALYGSQWVYLQQARLAEASVRGGLPSPADVQSGRTERRKIFPSKATVVAFIREHRPRLRKSS